jgi:hypothetical protein
MPADAPVINVTGRFSDLTSSVPVPKFANLRGAL